MINIKDKKIIVTAGADFNEGLKKTIEWYLKNEK